MKRKEIINGKQECSMCKEILPIDSFHKSSLTCSGFYGACKKCRNTYNETHYGSKEALAGKKRDYYKKNREVTLAKNRERNKIPRIKARHKAYAKKYREANKEKLALMANKWFVKNRTKVAEDCRKRKYKQYNITLADYDRMFEEQDGNCKICGLMEINKRLAVDHDHKTGKVRGLLCTRCNVTLGRIEENQETLWNMIEYLKEHENKLEGAK